MGSWYKGTKRGVLVQIYGVKWDLGYLLMYSFNGLLLTISVFMTWHVNIIQLKWILWSHGHLMSHGHVISVGTMPGFVFQKAPNLLLQME